MANSKKAKGTSTKDQSVGESIEDLGAAAAETGGQIKDTASNLTDQVTEQATEQVTSQKERVVDTLETVALLIHQAGEQAQQQDKDLLAKYADKAATQVGQWSESIAQQDVKELTQTTAQFARREPMLFVGGALAAGFLGARFLRSSAQQPQQSDQGESSSNGGSLPDIDGGTTDLPAYDADQSTSASSAGMLDAPFETETTSGVDVTANAGGILGDYEGSVLEEDAFGADADTTALNDPDNLESPENL